MDKNYLVQLIDETIKELKDNIPDYQQILDNLDDMKREINE